MRRAGRFPATGHRRTSRRARAHRRRHHPRRADGAKESWYRVNAELPVAGVTFDDVGKIYPDGTHAVSGMDLGIEDGEFMVLVGPSGCGKTTRSAWSPASRTSATARIRIGDRVVNDVPARDRDIAMVFQSYALYPHLSVYDNIAFGLRLRKTPKDEIDKRVRERRASSASRSSSTGSRARSRAVSGNGSRWDGRSSASLPAYLMDEPLSNLDAKLRVHMRAEIAASARSGRHHPLRHARPGGGDDDGPSRRGDAQGPASAGRRRRRSCTTDRSTSSSAASSAPPR